MNWQSSSRVSARALVASLFVASAALCPSLARADVRYDGDWDDDKEVSLDLDRVPRNEAVKRVAQAAGWSLVFDAPSGDAIDVHVKEQPVEKVLNILLADGHNYVAKLDDSLLVIKRVDGADAQAVPIPPIPAIPPIPPIPPIPAIPPIPPIPPVPPIAPSPPAAADAPEHGNDRVVTGGSLRIEKNDVAGDVTVMGGNVDVFGKATGDVVAMGGSVRIHKGAHVFGDATAVGGTLSIEDGARVDGDVGVLGGVLRRGKDAEIKGDVKAHGRGHRHRHRGRDQVDTEATDTKVEHVSTARRVVSEAGSKLTQTALLFVFGAVLLALGASRMESLKLQIATRPMRMFATGVLASLASVVLLIALCVTVIGIPFAIIGVLLGFVATCAGLVAGLETVGGALLGHKTKNPYVHLAFGCLLFMLLGAIPFVGNFVVVAAILVGIGSVAATRAAGLIPTKNRSTGTPYRDTTVI
jgi:hypothetical protein